MRCISVLAILLGVASVCVAQPSGKVPIDQLPMYGGMDRAAYPELKAADEKLIEGTTQAFGSRETASQAFVSRAFTLYMKDDLAGAMRRFNQAWLLNPSNPEVFWGFGSVLNDRGEYCSSMKMLEKAIELNIPVTKGFFADAGFIGARCALTNQSLTAEERNKLLEKSEDLFKRAERDDPNKAYVYSTWARSYYAQDKHSEAWEMIAKQRNAGGKPNERFLSLLRSKMPEPARWVRITLAGTDGPPVKWPAVQHDVKAWGPAARREKQRPQPRRVAEWPVTDPILQYRYSLKTYAMAKW